MDQIGGLRGFWRDFTWAVRVSATSAVLGLTVLLNGGIAAVAGHPEHRVLPAWALLAIPLGLFEIGFLGTQRVFFFRQMRSEALSGEDIWSLSWSFFWRFVRLGVMWLVLEGVLDAILYPLVGHNSLIWTTVITGLIGDVLLTFAGPALVFSTDSAGEALSISLRLAGSKTRMAWPYLLAPGLTLVAVGQAWTTQGRPTLPGVALSTGGAVLGLWFKGAIVRLYLRLSPDADLVVGPARERTRAQRNRARDASWSAPPHQIIPERMPDEPSIADIASRLDPRPKDYGSEQ